MTLSPDTKKRHNESHHRMHSRPLRMRMGFWGVGFTLVGGFLAGLFVMTFVSAGEIYKYQDTFDGVHLPQVDAIVVLSGGRGRFMAAGDVWYRYWEASKATTPPMLYLSGTGPHATWAAVSQQFRPGVLSALKTENVILERDSLDTEENAFYLGRYVKERGWTRVLLITSSYHMRRSLMIFKNTLDGGTFPQVAIETYSVFQDPFEAEEWRTSLQGIRVTLLEYLKWLFYRTRA